VSRPTNVSKYAQADAWMNETFGSSMGPYLTADQADPIGVAIVEVDRVLKKAGTQKLI
jgi:hypothetical protein